jgi:hypothetical protein
LVVRPIFLNQGFTDGRDTCGPFEQGKDCYFTKTSELTGTDVSVVQTKKGKITKASTPKDNLDGIVTQLRTALDTSVLLANKRKQMPIEAFLVCSGEINETARAHIADQLKDPRLKFVDVELLIPLIDRYIPELWLNIDSDVISYFRAVCAAIEQGSELFSGGVLFGNENNNLAAVDNIYAPVYVFRAKMKPELKGRHLKKKTERRQSDSSLPATSLVQERDRLLLVVGDGGSGKSTVLRRIAYELARRPIESQKDVRIPILLRAQELTEEPFATLIDHALRRISILSPGIRQPFTADDLTQGRVVVMVDGLDEIGNDLQADSVMQTILRFHSEYPKCQVIVTSRSTQYIRTSDYLKSFGPYNIMNFSLAQAEKIIKAFAKEQSLSVEESGEILRQLQEVHGISLTPLIVTIFVATSDITKRDVPPNITELFKKYTELMLGRWDEGKQLYQQIQAPVKDLVLQQVAFKMHDRRQTSVPANEFREMIHYELKSRGFEEESPLLYEEIIERSGLFRRDTEKVEFRHLLFQEFFAGRAITDSEYIDRVLDDEWWKRPIVFYFGEHPNDTVSLIRLGSSLEEKHGEKSFIAATTVGLSLQACYFAQVEEKARAYGDVIRAIVEARSETEFKEDFRDLAFLMLIGCYFWARESLALSNLKIFVERVQNGLLEIYKEDAGKQDEVRLWFIVGLLQSGLYDVVHIYVERFKPKDPTLLFALKLQITEASAVRMLADSTRAELRALTKIVDERLEPKWPEIKKRIERETKLIDRPRGAEKIDRLDEAKEDSKGEEVVGRTPTAN